MKVLFFSDGLTCKDSGIEKVSRRNLELITRIVGSSNIDVILTYGDRKADDLEIKADNIWIIKCGNNKLERFYNYLNLRFNISSENLSFFLKVVRANNYSTIFLDNSMYGILIKKIKRIALNVAVITFFHDFKLDLSKKWLRKRGISYLLQALAMIYNERLSARLSDHLICLTKRDQASVKSHYNKDSLVLPVTLPDIFKTGTVNIQESDDLINILFVGVDYFPNIQGIEWFIRMVFHKLPARLFIVGKGLEKYTHLRSHDNIHLIGYVPQQTLNNYYYNADCVIIPLFEGGGMKVKVAEALMFGKFVFGTSEAFEGYELDFSKTGGLCNTEDEFISSMTDWWRIYDHKKFNPYSRKIFLDSYTESVTDSVIRKILL